MYNDEKWLVAAFPCRGVPESWSQGGVGLGGPPRPGNPWQGGLWLQENVAANPFPFLYILIFLYLFIYIGIYNIERLAAG